MTIPRILPTPPIVSQYCPEWDLIWFPGLIPGAIFVCVYIARGVFLGDCTNGTLTIYTFNGFGLFIGQDYSVIVIEEYGCPCLTTLFVP